MGICESSNNQTPAATNPITTNLPTTNAATNNQGGIISSITNSFGSNTNQQAQQQNNTGILDTITNAIGSNQTTTTNPNSKLETVKKVGEFVVQNKDALGNLIK